MKVKTHSQKVPSATFKKVDTNQKISKTFARLALAVGISVVLNPVANAFDAASPPPVMNPLYWSRAEVSPTTKKEYTNVKIHKRHNENTYVQIVDIASGAQVKMLQYKATNDSVPKFWLNTIDEWWRQLGDNRSSRVSVVNGQFYSFDLNFHPTQPWNLVTDPNPLMFGVKANFHVITEGHPDAIQANRPYLRQLNIGVKRVWTSDIDLHDSSAKHAIVGYNINATPQYNEPNNRTALCALSYISWKPYKYMNVLLVYSGENKTGDQMHEDLKGLGCAQSDIVVLDGGGSTKLITKGAGKVLSGDFRRIPQAIGIMNNP